MCILKDVQSNFPEGVSRHGVNCNATTDRTLLRVRSAGTPTSLPTKRPTFFLCEPNNCVPFSAFRNTENVTSNSTVLPGAKYNNSNRPGNCESLLTSNEGFFECGNAVLVECGDSLIFNL